MNAIIHRMNNLSDGILRALNNILKVYYVRNFICGFLLALEHTVFVLLNDKSRMKGDFHIRFREKFKMR